MTTFNDIQANSLILVTCPKGLSSFLAEEVATLKFNVLSNFQSGVSLRGSFQDCMPLNLGLSTAHHVLFLLKEFSCASPETLYKEIASIDWENIVPRGGYVSVTSVVHTPSILDTRFANLKCKDAIMTGLPTRRENAATAGTCATGRSCTCIGTMTDVSCISTRRANRFRNGDTGSSPAARPCRKRLPPRSCGRPDGRAAYRLSIPCAEAAIAIEAALRALRRAPGILRTNFGFMHCAAYRREDYLSLVKFFSSRETADFKGKILASDIDAAVLLDARRNAALARVEEFIEFAIGDFRETDVPPGPGVVIFNPEYGIRLGEAEELSARIKTSETFSNNAGRRLYGFRFHGELRFGQTHRP